MDRHLSLPNISRSHTSIINNNRALVIGCSVLSVIQKPAAKLNTSFNAILGAHRFFLQPLCSGILFPSNTSCCYLRLPGSSRLQMNVDVCIAISLQVELVITRMRQLCMFTRATTLKSLNSFCYSNVLQELHII